MLELKKIKKSYTTGEFKQVALKEVSLKFRKNEFVAILGASGSGKTTLLNIIGGLDRYDSGDLIINDQSTKKFKDTQWDAYRNNCVGFIFQSYNLIGHISILANVEMSLTLSGVSAAERRKKAMKALEEVGLKDHAHKKPNQLSGGQMQRVAIARALVNDPDIILADEPTGALDTNTSVQIMNLIKKIAADKLVIMVTHNPELAQKYATRIVQMQDGRLLEDSNPITKEEDQKQKVEIKKTAMSFPAALKLSFQNIKTKKGRTALTAFAASIGIIGIALILALSNGFQIQIDQFEQESLSQMPIMITEQAMTMDADTMGKYQENIQNSGLEKYTSKEEVAPLPDMSEELLHTNVLTKEYVDYIEKLDKTLVGGISYMKTTGMNIITQDADGNYLPVGTGSNTLSQWQLFPSNMNHEPADVILNNYDILKGEIKANEPGLILIVDSQNRISVSQLEMLGFKTDENVSFDDILGKELKVILNDVYYVDRGNFFQVNQDYASLYQNFASLTLKVQAIIRGKEGKEMITAGTGVAYTSALTDWIIENNQNSQIVQFQQNVNYNVLTGQPFDETSSTNTKEMTLAYLGSDSVPVAIYLYPKDFAAKDQITSYLDQYNEGKEEVDTILYNDMASMISSLSSNIMDAITIVLIAFSAISLVVSSIMIGIITYISVLERTKEIGILRALGARKKDIKRVFNAETFIIGLCSGLLGIIIARLLVIPANMIIESLTELPNVAKLNPVHAILLIGISIILTIISGSIPSRVASKKDPVEALRTE